jgi:hypothetical protein
VTGGWSARARGYARQRAGDQLASGRRSVRPSSVNSAQRPSRSASSSSKSAHRTDRCAPEVEPDRARNGISMGAQGRQLSPDLSGEDQVGLGRRMPAVASLSDLSDLSDLPLHHGWPGDTGVTIRKVPLAAWEYRPHLNGKAGETMTMGTSKGDKARPNGTGGAVRS